MRKESFTDTELVGNLVQHNSNDTAIRYLYQEHFEFLSIILKISYSEALNKDIRAQGELLSTKLFSLYLEEQKIDHCLLPALDFMTLDNQDEPQVGTIKVKLAQLLQKHKEVNIFVTQGYITRNAKGEVDNLKRGGSDYSASLIAAAVNAMATDYQPLARQANNQVFLPPKGLPAGPYHLPTGQRRAETWSDVHDLAQGSRP